MSYYRHILIDTFRIILIYCNLQVMIGGGIMSAFVHFKDPNERVKTIIAVAVFLSVFAFTAIGAVGALIKSNAMLNIYLSLLIKMLFVEVILGIPFMVIGTIGDDEMIKTDCMTEKFDNCTEFEIDKLTSDQRMKRELGARNPVYLGNFCRNFRDFCRLLKMGDEDCLKFVTTLGSLSVLMAVISFVVIVGVIMLMDENERSKRMVEEYNRMVRRNRWRNYVER